ncbi:hypothetical protein F0L68_22030 [Solihabitans fulvus]|uniref:Uncharacterized protein n=1 Tax=Solihabitans fulvus TaxID=1892852 RepID=A0A5B2X6H9_9PSEU|nr:hypothetical protein [Solihabitans fulvus]KAA2258542.1 hypothetical protein F0L68_22030 [Solihabitans fulvus]
MPPAFKIGLGTFIDYVNSGPGHQANIVARQRQMYLDPDRKPWNYYGPMVRAIRRAAADPDPEFVLDAAARAVQDTSKGRHFAELRDGFLSWWASARCTVVKVGSTTLRQPGVEISVAPQLGVREQDGGRLAVFLYLKEPPLTGQTAKIPLRVLENAMEDILPGAGARILDVRRGKLLRLPANAPSRRLDAAIAGGLASYATIWQAIA